MIVNKKSLYYFRLLFDLFLLNCVFIFSAVFTQSLHVLISRPKMFALEAILSFVWYYSANVTRFYEYNKRDLSYLLPNLFKAVFIQVVTSVIFIFIIKEDLFTRNFIIVYSVLLFLIISMRILAFKSLIKVLRKRGVNVRNLIIIGAQEVGIHFKDMIVSNPDYGYNFLGFIDNNNKATANFSDMEEYINKNGVDEAVIALPESEFDQLDDIIRVCNRNAVKVHIIPDYFRFMSKKFEIDLLGNFPVISVRSEPLDEIQWKMVKRIFDIIFSSLACIFILSWLFPILAILTKLDSKGPVLFIQDRLGVHNKKFKCYKFRTMRPQKPSEKDEFKPVVENDDRMTKIGKFLRKSNIDELPQFLNVFKGDMSIVGPRPHALAFHQKYKEIVEDIKLRHNVKPGITGWAQVHGLRGDVPDEEENIKRTKKRIEYDIWYIENWTLWLDIQIIFFTVWQMLKGDTKGI